MSNTSVNRRAKVYDVSKSATILHYLRDMHTPYCGIMSHVNSGKTSAMCVKSQIIAKNQHPDADGIRWTRHLFVRGTQGDLLRGTLRTFTQWIDEKKLNGIRRSTPINAHLQMEPLHDQNQRFPEVMFYRLEDQSLKSFPYMIGAKWNPDTEEFEDGVDVSGQLIGDVFPKGTFIDAQFDFVPLDNPDWEATLLGTEYTCGNMDEPDSMNNIEEVLTKVPSRMGRYPSVSVAPITCDQINLSFNPAPRDSFMQTFFSKENEKYGRKLYRIPPPFLMIPDPQEPDNFFKAQFVKNPNAEGVSFSGKGFRHWQEIIDANRHDPNKIRRDVLGEWTRGSGGALVHPEFNYAVHVQKDVQSDRSRVLFCSVDHGNNGAAVLAQQVHGGLRVLEEIPAEGTPSYEFILQTVIPHINGQYRGFEVVITGDPTGSYTRESGDSPFQLFENQGFLVESDTPLDPQIRWSAVNMLLKYKDGLVIDEQCTHLIKGFEGGYTFKKDRYGRTLKQVDKKNPLTAFQDCLQAVACLVYDGYEEGASRHLDPFNSSTFYRSKNNQQRPEQEEFLWV